MQFGDVVVPLGQVEVGRHGLSQSVLGGEVARGEHGTALGRAAGQARLVALQLGRLLVDQPHVAVDSCCRTPINIDDQSRFEKSPPIDEV